MKHAWLPLLLAIAALAQEPGFPPEFSPRLGRGRYGAGKRQQSDALSKEDFKNNSRDAAELVKLSQSLEASVTRDGSYIVNANDIRTAEQIEKLARKIRGRLKPF
jgi:hypothetical protein